VEHDDGQVPAPRRPGPPLFRRPSRRGPASPVDVPRVADISELLGEIDALRTSLSTDLSLAAAALEAGADGLAAELVDGDLAALHAFEASALGHLQSLDTALPDQAAAPPVRRMHRRMLPAAPVLAAAAALIGVLGGVGTGSGPASPAPAMTSAAAASWELNRLADEGAPAGELREAAEELNDRLAALVAVADSDPAAAQQALLLLRDTTQVLSSAGQPGELAAVLRETRALVAQLTAVLPQVPRTARTTGKVPVVPPVEVQPRRSAPAQQDGRSTTTTGSGATPAATPAPKASTTPAPAPKPTPASSPSASPTAAPDSGPLFPGRTGSDYLPDAG
jgi:hypothetical protein